MPHDSRAVLVTGGAGYIGSHTCKSLREAGFEPVVYDNLVFGHEWAVKWGPFERGDILDGERLTSVLRKYRVVGVIHFAGFAYVGESVTNPSRYYTNNVAGSISLLEAMRSADVRDIVFSSTCATYGVPETVPIREDHPQRPINPYGFTKLAIERMILDYAAAYGFRYGVLRYFNAAGADPKVEVGEDHEPETHLLPLSIRAAVDNTFTLHVFGADYDTMDGTAIRDYIHVTDLAKAHVLGLEHLRRDGGSFCVNLGTGTGHSVLEIVEIVERVTGRCVKRRNVDRREGDPPVLVADNAAARRLLGWVPKHAAIEDIVRSAFDWHRKHGNLRRNE